MSSSPRTTRHALAPPPEPIATHRTTPFVSSPVRPNDPARHVPFSVGASCALQVVKLGDFGVTRVLENTMAMAETQVGTPYYMSPELAQNKPYNAKADVWALGCILYEMAALSVPFPAQNFAQLVQMVTRREPAKLPSCFSKDLGVLIRGMMRKDPMRRANIGQVIRHPYVQRHLESFAQRYAGDDGGGEAEEEKSSVVEEKAKQSKLEAQLKARARSALHSMARP